MKIAVEVDDFVTGEKKTIIVDKIQKRKDTYAFDFDFYYQNKKDNEFSLQDLGYNPDDYEERGEIIQICSPVGKINEIDYEVEKIILNYSRTSSEPIEIPKFKDEEEASKSDIWSIHKEQFKNLPLEEKQKILSYLIDEIVKINELKYFFKIKEIITIDPDTKYVKFNYSLLFSKKLTN